VCAPLFQQFNSAYWWRRSRCAFNERSYQLLDRSVSRFHLFQRAISGALLPQALDLMPDARKTGAGAYLLPFIDSECVSRQPSQGFAASPRRLF
jgi:hypothetical protein